MQLNDNDTETLALVALNFSNALQQRFGNRLDRPTISNIVDEPSPQSFRIACIAYDYFPLCIEYERGALATGILFGDRLIPLQNSQQWWNTLD